MKIHRADAGLVHADRRTL